MAVVVDSGCHDRGGGGGDEDDFEIKEEKGRPKRKGPLPFTCWRLPS